VEVDVLDARVALAGEASGGRDLVIGDAFGGPAVPWHLTTREVVAEVARILRPDGVYAINLIDHPPDRFAYAELATVASVFPNVAVVAAESSIEGRSGGNFVIVASARPLPLDPLRRRLSQRGSPLAVASWAEARPFAGRAPVLTDDYAPVDQLLTPHGS
jgi:spermidine synthase